MMYPEPDPPPTPATQSSLPMILGMITLGGFLLLLILVSGGFFLYVVFGAFLMVGLGMMHYFLWGQALDQHTAGQRSEDEADSDREQDLRSM